MNDGELIGKVHSVMYHQCQNRVYTAPVDVLTDIDVLPKQKYENWQFERVFYLDDYLFLSTIVRKQIIIISKAFHVRGSEGKSLYYIKACRCTKIGS